MQVLWLWNLSVAGNIAAYSLLVRTRMLLWGVALELSIVGLLASAVILVRVFGIFTIKVERDRSLRFIQAAWGCGLFALLLFAMMPAYEALKGVVFSHAYFGGYRHAFTVGFISLMILGVSSKIVAILGGLSPSERGPRQGSKRRQFPNQPTPTIAGQSDVVASYGWRALDGRLSSRLDRYAFSSSIDPCCPLRRISVAGLETAGRRDAETSPGRQFLGRRTYWD
jgi:hypothetical protein